MGTEGQGRPLGERPVSVRVAVPLGEQMVLLALRPLFLLPPQEPAYRAGAQLPALPRAGPRAGLGEVTAAAPRAWGRAVGRCCLQRGQGSDKRGRGKPEWLDI